METQIYIPVVIPNGHQTDLYMGVTTPHTKGVKDGDGEVQTQEITVYDYMVKIRMNDLGNSADLPCINVG